MPPTMTKEMEHNLARLKKCDHVIATCEGILLAAITENGFSSPQKVMSASGLPVDFHDEVGRLGWRPLSCQE